MKCFFISSRNISAPGGGEAALQNGLLEGNALKVVGSGEQPDPDGEVSLVDGGALGLSHDGEACLHKDL